MIIKYFHKVIIRNRLLSPDAILILSMWTRNEITLYREMSIIMIIVDSDGRPNR